MLDPESVTAPQRIVSPGWGSAPVPDDPEDIALMQKIHATLALVREWFPRSPYPTKVQIQEEWEKPVLDLERALVRILAEVLNAERVLTSSPARPAFLGPASDDLEDSAAWAAASVRFRQSMLPSPHQGELDLRG